MDHPKADTVVQPMKTMTVKIVAAAKTTTTFMMQIKNLPKLHKTIIHKKNHKISQSTNRDSLHRAG